jgi:hypothetical protein
MTTMVAPVVAAPLMASLALCSSSLLIQDILQPLLIGLHIVLHRTRVCRGTGHVYAPQRGLQGLCPTPRLHHNIHKHGRLTCRLPLSATLLLTWALSAGKPGPSAWSNPTTDTWGQNGLADRIVYIRQPKEEENYPRDHGRTGGGRSLSPCNRLAISLSSSSCNRL